MFNILQTSLSNIFDKIKGRGSLNVKAVEDVLVDIRKALLDADVSLSVVKSFISKVKDQAVNEKVLKSVTPGQQVIKIVNDVMVGMLQSSDDVVGLNLLREPPVAILSVGLQGSGKTTSTAKLGLHLSNKNKKKVLMASLDIYRPGAQAQLSILGEQINVDVLSIIDGQQPVDIARRAMQVGKLSGYDIVLLDTAGRLSIDSELMLELHNIKNVVVPQEVLLVADSMTGQDSVDTAKNFNDAIGLTGIILTRVDGDSRGGAALSMCSVTGCAIKYMGSGEKLDDLEVFDAERVASRILGMGDIVSLVEKAQELSSEEESARMAKRMMSGNFDLNDLKSQLIQMRKMGGLSGIMSMIPGVKKMKDRLQKSGFSEQSLLQQEAIIGSMTKSERNNPSIIHASRKRRIALGSGTTVQDINKLLKQFKTMEKTMKKMGGGSFDKMFNGGNNLPKGFGF